MGGFSLPFILFSKMISDFIPIFDKNKYFELPIIDTTWLKVWVFKYPQATIQESIYFYENTKYPISLLREYKDKFFEYKYDRVETDKLLLYSIDEILLQIMNTRHKRSKSAFHNAPLLKEASRKSTRGVNIQSVLERFNLSLTDLLQSYSMEQLDWMQDQIIFYYNEQDKKTRWINDWVMNRMDDNGVDKAKAKELLEMWKKAKVVKKEILSVRKQ